MPQPGSISRIFISSFSLIRLSGACSYPSASYEHALQWKPCYEMGCIIGGAGDGDGCRRNIQGCIWRLINLIVYWKGEADGVEKPRKGGEVRSLLLQIFKESMFQDEMGPIGYGQIILGALVKMNCGATLLLPVMMYRGFSMFPRKTQKQLFLPAHSYKHLPSFHNYKRTAGVG